MKDDFLRIVQWEYTALRTEIEECYKHSFHMFAWGTTLLLTSGGLVLRYLPPEYLFLVMLVAAVLAITWLGQLVRINRAGRFLRFIEAKVNAYLEQTAPHWQPVCAGMQERVQEWEQALLVKNFGYDFSKPLQWEIWLSTQRGRTPTTGHLGWLYVFEAGVFPGVFLACPFLYVTLVGAAGYWHGIWAGISIVFVLIYGWKLPRWLLLK